MVLGMHICDQLLAEKCWLDLEQWHMRMEHGVDVCREDKVVAAVLTRNPHRYPSKSPAVNKDHTR